MVAPRVRSKWGPLHCLTSACQIEGCSRAPLAGTSQVHSHSGVADAKLGGSAPHDARGMLPAVRFNEKDEAVGNADMTLCTFNLAPASKRLRRVQSITPQPRITILPESRTRTRAAHRFSLMT